MFVGSDKEEEDSITSKVKKDFDSKHHSHAHRSSEKCAQRIDIAEQIYSYPTDMTGDGYLDLLVGTMNGRMVQQCRSIL